MDIQILLLLIGGLVVLTLGGDLLIRGSTKLASAFGISALVIGLTIVAFGTSAPELVVSLKASLSGNPNIAIANVVGSNIFNVLLILGLCALFAPLIVSSQLVRLDVPIMIGASLLALLFSLNGHIGFIEGLILFSILICYTTFLIIKSKKESRKVKKEFDQEFKSDEKLTLKLFLIQTSLIAVGLVLLVVGGGWFVDGAIQLAKSFGVSDTVIGLTIVAAGTSLPEVAASIIATIKGERDLAIGNVIGSNIYNIFCILGLSSMISPEGLLVSSEMLNFDIPLMLAVAVACIPIFISGYTINKWEGFLFFSCYCLYTVFLVFNATNHDYFENYKIALVYFGIPTLIFITLIISFQAFKTLKGYRPRY